MIAVCSSKVCLRNSINPRKKYTLILRNFHEKSKSHLFIILQQLHTVDKFANTLINLQLLSDEGLKGLTLSSTNKY